MRHTVGHQINPSVVGSHLHSNLQWPFRCVAITFVPASKYSHKGIDANLFPKRGQCLPRLFKLYKSTRNNSDIDIFVELSSEARMHLRANLRKGVAGIELDKNFSNVREKRHGRGTQERPKKKFRKVISCSCVTRTARRSFDARS